MFLSPDETNPSNYLDEKNRGVSGGKTGALVWNIDNVEHSLPDRECVCGVYVLCMCCV